MNSKPVVIQSEDLNAEPAAWLAERCELVACPFEHTERFEAALRGAQALVIRTYTRVDRALLDKAPALKVVGRAGVGLDNVDLHECARRGVAVVYTPDANTIAVSEYVMALTFDALRPRVFLDSALTNDRWKAVRRELNAPRQLCELTMGIYGMGRIGRRVARAAAGLSMAVIYHDIREIEPDACSGAEPVGREELLRRADVLTIHVDGRSSNRRLIDGHAMSMTRPSVILINTSRGMVVDPRAVAEFMRINRGACAMLDVHDPEPIEPASCLLGIPNVHLSPHIAASTATAHENMGWVVRDVWRVLSGEKPMCPAEILD